MHDLDNRRLVIGISSNHSLLLHKHSITFLARTQSIRIILQTNKNATPHHIDHNTGATSHGHDLYEECIATGDSV